MAGGMIGADPEQLRSLHAALNREADTTDALMRAVRSQLANTQWTGTRAEQFRATWQDQFEPTLRSLQESLVQAGQEVEAQRQDLLRATGGGG